MDNILVPTDGSEATRVAAKFANEQATKFGANVHVLCVQELIESQANITEQSVYIPEDGEVMDEYFDTVIDELSSDIEFKKSSKKGINTASEILEYADENEIDHIIMGTSGKTGARRILIGSVAEKVVRISKVPVTTVKEDSPV